MKLARLRQIISVFVKYGFDDLVLNSGIKRYLPRYQTPSDKKTQSRTRAKNLRLALEELGPTFLKFGQYLSNRPDIFPVEYLQELEKLQDRVAPFPEDQAMEILAGELNADPAVLFANISRRPQASASLSQIHPATLKDGTQIVLKIQRPDLRDLITMDINILYRLAGLLDKHSSWSGYFNFTEFVKEFEQVILDELDFNKEARNLERLAKNLRYFEHVRIPKVYWDYTRARVLAMERIFGSRLTPEKAAGLPISRRHLAEEILEAYLKQIVEDGFFHADPHLGNLLFEPDGGVALVDLGIVGHIDNDLKFQVGQILISFANQEADKITGVLLRIGNPRSDADLKGLEQGIREITAKYHYITAAELGLGRAVIDLAKTAGEHGLRLPQSFNMLSKTFFYLDVAINQLCPKLNYMEFLKRSAQRVLANLWRTQYDIGHMTETFLETNRLWLDGPGRLNLLLDKLVRDEVAIKFEHEHLDGMLKTLHQSANRLSFAIVVGAIIVGSALIIRLRSGQTFFGYSLLGIAGFIVAGLLGLYLLVRILRTERF